MSKLGGAHRACAFLQLGSGLAPFNTICCYCCSSLYLGIAMGVVSGRICARSGAKLLFFGSLNSVVSLTPLAARTLEVCACMLHRGRCGGLRLLRTILYSGGSLAVGLSRLVSAMASLRRRRSNPLWPAALGNALSHAHRATLAASLVALTLRRKGTLLRPVQPSEAAAGHRGCHRDANLATSVASRRLVGGRSVVTRQRGGRRMNEAAVPCVERSLARSARSASLVNSPSLHVASCIWGWL